jgi:hypothetical protein
LKEIVDKSYFCETLILEVCALPKETLVFPMGALWRTAITWTTHGLWTGFSNVLVLAQLLFVIVKFFGIHMFQMTFHIVMNRLHKLEAY